MGQRSWPRFVGTTAIEAREQALAELRDKGLLG
jgi:hypothetical protein